MGQRSDQVNPSDRSEENSLKQDGGRYASASAAGTEASDDTAEIRAGIEETRAEMSETIDAIQERLSPQHLKEQVKEQVREQYEEAKATVRDATIGKAEEMVRNMGDTIHEARYGLTETIRQNPIPSALVGIGLGWLLMNRRSGAPRRDSGSDYQNRYYRGGPVYSRDQRDYAGGAHYYAGGSYANHDDMVAQGKDSARSTLRRAQETAENVVERAQEQVGTIADRAQQTVGNAVSQVQETASNIGSQAQETASNLADQTQEAATYIADQAQYQAQRLEDRFQQTLYENPLAVGAVALALGTAVGFSLPQTQRENELLGDARDNLIDRAQEVAQDTLEKVQQVAGEVVDQAQTTVQERAKERGLTIE